MAAIFRILRASHQFQLMTISAVRSYIHYTCYPQLQLVLTTQDQKEIYYGYYGGIWLPIAYLNSYKMIPPTITEKMGIIFLLLVGQDKYMASFDREVFDSVSRCTITKLVLLREITTQYLIYDILPILFDKTE
jgi:hypothetical protein